MYKMKQNKISTFDVSSYLNKPTLFTKDYDICHLSKGDDISEWSLTYIEALTYHELNNIHQKAVILTTAIDGLNENDMTSVVPEIILTDNPERDFYLIVKEFFTEMESFSIHPSVVLDASRAVGVNVNIGEGCKIGKNVTIGDNTYIGKNVIINDNVSIGRSCYLKDSSIIGSDSFNFIRENDSYLYIPFFGELIIENDVWIGSKVIIEKPSLGKSYIKEDVKIDDLVQIGADCNIDKHTQIAAGSILGRGVKIGSNCHLGINTLIKPNIQISNNINTGIGAVVVSDLTESSTYIGNPAKILNKVNKWQA